MPKRKFSRKSSKKRSFKKRFKTPYGARKRYRSKKRHGRRFVSVRSVFPPTKRMVFKANATYGVNYDAASSIVDMQPGLLTFPFNPPAGSYNYELTPNYAIEGTAAFNANKYIGLDKFYSNDVAKGVYRYARVYGFSYEVEVTMPTLVTQGHVCTHVWTSSNGTSYAPLFPMDNVWNIDGRPFCKVKPYKPGGSTVIRGFVKMYKALGYTKLQWEAGPAFQMMQSVAAEQSERVGFRIILVTGSGAAFDANSTQTLNPTIRVRFRTYVQLMGESSNTIARGTVV
nr:MAG: hypothetical protein [Chemarfal virus 83]